MHDLRPAGASDRDGVRDPVPAQRRQPRPGQVPRPYPVLRRMGVRAPRSLTLAVELRTIVARLLEQEPGAALCDACLAFAAAAPLIETRRVVEALVSMRPALKRGLNHCESCRRAAMVTLFRPGQSCLPANSHAM